MIDSTDKIFFFSQKIAFKVAIGRAKVGQRCKLYKEAGKWYVENN